MANRGTRDQASRARRENLIIGIAREYRVCRHADRRRMPRSTQMIDEAPQFVTALDNCVHNDGSAADVFSGMFSGGTPGGRRGRLALKWLRFSVQPNADG